MINLIKSIGFGSLLAVDASCQQAAGITQVVAANNFPRLSENEASSFQTSLFSYPLSTCEKVNVIWPYQSYGLEESPGCPTIKHAGEHAYNSPVYLQKSHQLKALHTSKFFKLFLEFERILYRSNEFRFLILKKDLPKAQILAKQDFKEYIAPYEEFGCTPFNIIKRTHEGTSIVNPMVHLTGFLAPKKDEQITPAGAFVKTSSEKLCGSNGYCMPGDLVARHEVKHGELGFIQPVELLPTLDGQIVVDQFYKQINGIPLDVTVNYNQTIRVLGRDFPAGELANKYRDLLEAANGDLSLALRSRDSIEYLTGLDFDFLDSITDQNVLDTILENLDLFRSEVEKNNLDLSGYHNLNRDQLYELFQNMDVIKRFKENGIVFNSTAEGCHFIKYFSDHLETVLDYVANYQATPEELYKINMDIFTYSEAAKDLMTSQHISFKTLTSQDRNKLEHLLIHPEPVKYLMQKHQISFETITALDGRVFYPLLQNANALQYLMETHGVTFETLIATDSSVLVGLLYSSKNLQEFMEFYSLDFQSIIKIPNLYLIFQRFDTFKCLVKTYKLTLETFPFSDKFIEDILNQNIETIKNFIKKQQLSFESFLKLSRIFISNLKTTQEFMDNYSVSLERLDEWWPWNFILLKPVFDNPESIRYLIEKHHVSFDRILSNSNFDTVESMLTHLDTIKELTETFHISFDEFSSADNLPQILNTFEAVRRLMEEYNVKFSDIKNLWKGKTTIILQNLASVEFLLTTGADFKQLSELSENTLLELLNNPEWMEYLIKISHLDIGKLLNVKGINAIIKHSQVLESSLKILGIQFDQLATLSDDVVDSILDNLESVQYLTKTLHLDFNMWAQSSWALSLIKHPKTVEHFMNTFDANLDQILASENLFRIIENPRDVDYLIQNGNIDFQALLKLPKLTIRNIFMNFESLKTLIETQSLNLGTMTPEEINAFFPEV